MTAVTWKVDGLAELDRKLLELGNPKAQGAALRASVSKAMKTVKAKAQANIASVSPGLAEIHRTYKGRLVGAGFASRSLTVVTRLSRDKQQATAMLGVKREAFYAINFLELGTSRTPPHPWLVPAFQASRKSAVAEVADVLRKRIKRIAGKGRK